MNDLTTYKGSVIYKAINLVNGKIYVGKAVNYSNRIKQHKWSGSRNVKTAFYRAIAKYGFDNFKFEILEYCEKDQLYIRESFWILKLGSLNSLIGYNLRVDIIGRSGFSHSNKTKSLISAKCKGVIPWHAGKKVGNLKSVEGIQRFKDQMTGGLNPLAKTVYQLNLKGEFIKKFDSASTAARELNINFRGICRIAAGQKTGEKKRVSYKGFKWSYTEPGSVVTQDLDLFNCWKLLTGDAEDNQQRSLSNQERSTTIAEMRVEASASKQETSLQKDDDIVCSCKKLQAGVIPGTNVTTWSEHKVWELAAKALKNFVLSIDKYREDLIVVTEYHAEFDENLHGYDIFSPAGKMLKEKFLVPSYYDILLFTNVTIINEGEMNEYADYEFAVRPTRKYPYARAMMMFEQNFIPNDLQRVLTKMREYLNLPIPARS